PAHLMLISLSGGKGEKGDRKEGRQQYVVIGIGDDHEAENRHVKDLRDRDDETDSRGYQYRQPCRAPQPAGRLHGIIGGKSHWTNRGSGSRKDWCDGLPLPGCVTWPEPAHGAPSRTPRTCRLQCSPFRQRQASPSTAP